MKPRRTVDSTTVFRLEGGNEDNDLWVHRGTDQDGAPVIVSVWQPSELEREAIANGANLELVVWGDGTPPVALGTTIVRLGKS